MTRNCPCRFPWPTRWRAVAAALVALMAVFQVRAQSLADAVSLARSCDATYLGARANVDAMHYHYEASKGTRLPSVNLQIQAARNGSRGPDASMLPPAMESQTSSSAGATLGASQTIFNRQNDIVISQDELIENSARAELAQAEQDLIVRVSQAYFGELSAAEAVRAAQGNRKAIAEQLASVKRNFELGNATVTDIREAEARSDLARAQQIVADNELVVARVALDQVVGRPGVSPHPLRIPATLPPVLPSQMSDWAALVEEASPTLQQARLALSVAELETSRAKAGHLPTLTANASYGRNRQHYSASLPDSSVAGNGSSTGVSVTLSVPLFAGFAIQNRVSEAMALQEKAHAAVEGARNLALANVRAAYANALSQAAQIQALETAEASSKLALDATVFSYKAGIKLNLDVLNAQSQLYLAQRDAAAARYQYLLSTLKLRAAAGTLTSNDLVPMDLQLSG
jgi:outer membrane protein